MKALAAAFFFCAAMVLASLVDKPLSAAAGPVSEGDPLSRAFGSAKEAIGDTLFVRADEYFHGGMRHEHHEDESAEDLAREGVFERAGREHDDWVARVDHRIHAHDLMHLTKEQRKEMLPFFSWAVALDPYNTEAVLTTAFWLDKEFGKTEEAVRLLEKGARDNPLSWEIENELAELLQRLGRTAEAEEHFREAARKSTGKTLENFERVAMYTEWAQNLEKLGRVREALAAYELASRFFDGKTAEHLRSLVLGRIKELRVTR